MEYNGIFILAYDLLQKELKKALLPCDEAWEVCSEIYNDFLSSKHNVPSKSEYNCLCAYITNNYKQVLQKINK